MTDLFQEKASFYCKNLMHDFGLSAEQAAGLTGNLAHESGNFRYMQEIGHKSGRGGAGVAMWTGPRRRSFEAWCAHHGVSTSSDAGNYGYLKFELSGAYASCITALKRCATVDAATRSFCNTFEKPGKPMLSSRIAYARKALAILHPAHPAAVAPTPKPKAAPMAKKAKPKVAAVKKRTTPAAHVVQKAKHK